MTKCVASAPKKEEVNDKIHNCIHYKNQPLLTFLVSKKPACNDAGRFCFDGSSSVNLLVRASGLYLAVGPFCFELGSSTGFGIPFNGTPARGLSWAKPKDPLVMESRRWLYHPLTPPTVDPQRGRWPVGQRWCWGSIS